MKKQLLADVIVDLQYGDCGKGKVTHSLLKSTEYTHCVRYNGGHNAGHTIYHEGRKVVTHIVPSGVLRGVRSIIGPGCVVSPLLLEKEVKDLEEAGIKVKGNLFIDKRVNVIKDRHLDEDGDDVKIGTTRKGNGPAYRDKYDRKGVRFEELPITNPYQLTDIYEEFYETDSPVVALFEGAQGFGLDIDWGDYPYVTSSTCNVGGAVSNGVPPSAIRNVYGVAKAYQTYVGAKKFQPEGEIFNKIREVGNEYGATTGRPRQVDFLDIDQLVKAARINGVTDLIINKTDVLQEVNSWKIYKDGKLFDFQDEDRFVDFVKHYLLSKCTNIEDVIFSYSPNDI
jgi:adenylosuccinate synthase